MRDAVNVVDVTVMGSDGGKIEGQVFFSRGRSDAYHGGIPGSRCHESILHLFRCARSISTSGEYKAHTCASGTARVPDHAGPIARQVTATRDVRLREHRLPCAV